MCCHRFLRQPILFAEDHTFLIEFLGFSIFPVLKVFSSVPVQEGHNLDGYEWMGVPTDSTTTIDTYDLNN